MKQYDQKSSHGGTGGKSSHSQCYKVGRTNHEAHRCKCPMTYGSSSATKKRPNMAYGPGGAGNQYGPGQMAR